MSATYRFEGHAIVSANDCIADKSGTMPEALRNDADWRQFQSALDAAAITVLGRRSHEAAPNPRGRNRVVMSSLIRGVEKRADAWWWNPTDAPLAEALRRAAPDGGRVAVPGGRRVFDYFLERGFDAFHLTRVAGLILDGGVPLFSRIASGSAAEDLLAGNGLLPGPAERLDEGVMLTIWLRPS